MVTITFNIDIIPEKTTFTCWQHPLHEADVSFSAFSFSFFFLSSSLASASFFNLAQCFLWTNQWYFWQIWRQNITHYSMLLQQLWNTINASAHLVTVVRPLAAGALLGCPLLTACVTVLVILEASLAVKCTVDVFSCRLTLPIVLSKDNLISKFTNK